MSHVAFSKSASVSAWCPECQKHVTLATLRPWPEGVLAIGECPACRAKLAAEKPITWGGPHSDAWPPTAA